MRAAVVIEQCWHRVPGGTASAVVEQVAAVAATGRVDQVGVAARHGEPPPEGLRPAMPVRHLPLPRQALYRSWHRLRWPPVERATGPVDVVHATGYAIPPRTAPLVATLHDLAWRRDPSMFTRNGVRFFEAGLRCVIDDADLVLCPSQATLEDCAAAGIGRDRLRHVPWGMTTADVTAEAVAEVRERYGIPGRYVLTVGTLEPRKNVARLVEAFARLPHDDVTLVVVGPDGWGESPVAAAAARLGDRLRLTGFVPRSQLAPLYGGASVVCYPSLWEGYGLPVAEAMGAGAPVVTSAGTATEELVVGGAGVAVDPLDVDAIAGGIASVLDDDDLAGRLRAAGRARAEATTWAATAAATIAAYEEVIAR
ncbi:MAG TPA: glycosyltransferase family 1 protein [Acidimicrobiales bacterium]|nr:glycosyltransferase family 1 protein [Acidimicrobiales bacterium]